MCSSCNRKLYEKPKVKLPKLQVQKEKPPKVIKPRKVKKKHYRDHKKNYCEYCGFKALDKCQLDVDHIDGDHSNSHPYNLQTLCANCHRLKTKINRDGFYRMRD